MKELILAIISTLIFSQAVGAIPNLNCNNGHDYEGVVCGAIWWPEAKEHFSDSFCSGLSWHLATLTAFEKIDWISEILHPGYKWIGAFQDVNDPNYSEPEGGWKWVTGEAWDFTSESYGEPNNAGENEAHLELFFEHKWNDRSSSFDGYLAEYEPAPGPVTMFLLGSGLIVFAGFRKKSKK